MEREDDSKIFPQRLMEILSDPRSHGIIEWLENGRAFVVKDRAMFAEKIMPLYFSRHAKYSSFTRKLNRWNFVRVSSGPEIGALYHEFFLRDEPHLTAQMYCKNARSRAAMYDASLPAPTAATVNTGCCGNNNNDMNGGILKKPAGTMAIANPNSAAIHRPKTPPQRLSPPSLTGSVVSSGGDEPSAYGLPPEIPLGLLELLSKGTGGAGPNPPLPPNAVSSANGPTQPVPSRLLQQSQYANLLLERQIQILQQEQAKFLLLRQSLALQQQQQQQLLSRASLISPSTAAASAAPPQSQPPLSVASALEQLRHEDEERLCQLVNLRLEQERSRRDKEGTQPTNHRASAA